MTEKKHHLAGKPSNAKKPDDQVKFARLSIRCTQKFKDRARQKALSQGYKSLSEWVADLIEKEINKNH